MPLDENTEAQLASLADKISADIAAVLSQLLSTEVSVKLADISAPKITGDTAAVTEATVYSHSAFGEASFGSIHVFMDTAGACKIANLMAGSDEEAGEFDATKQEAFTSALNQSFTETLNQLGDESFKTTGFNTSVIDAENNTVANEAELAGLSFTINSENGLDAKASVDVSLDLVNGLIMVAGDMGGGSEAAADAGGATATGDTATVGDVMGADFASIVDSHNPEDIDEQKNLNLLMDIRLGLIVELGRAEMHLRDILKLTKGSIIELDRLSGEPVDLFVNNKLIARGEVVVIDDNFGLRITQLAGTMNADAMGLMMLDDE